MTTQQFDLVVKGGLVVTGGRIARSDIGVLGEKVAAIEPDLPATGVEVIEADGLYALPGAIDVHVHPVYLDDMRATSVAAAFGGVTTLIHFGYVRPGMPFIETLVGFREEGEGGSILDFGLHAGIFDAKNQLPHIPAAFELGICSYKVFMTYAKLEWMTDDYHMLAIMDAVAAHQGLVMVHCENGLATDFLEDAFLQKGRPPKETFQQMRPALLEAEATHRAMSMAQVAGCPIYVVHVSAGAVLDHIRSAKGQGWRVWAETCPQYLTLTDTTTQQLGPLAKIGPPLRTPEDNFALWQALADGTLDTVGSDHAPKAKKLDDAFFDAPYGSPQIETMLTLLYDGGVNAGHLTLPRLAQVSSENPARVFGLYPRKGSLQPGSDADIVLFDPCRRLTLSHSKEHSHASYSLYEGREVLGAPVLTMQRGKIVAQNGDLYAKPGDGQYLSISTKHLYD